MLTQEERAAIDKLWAKVITDEAVEEFRATYPVPPDQRTQRAYELFADAVARKDEERLHDAVAVGYYCAEFTKEFVPLFIEVLRGDWHCCHEDFVMHLQRLRDRRAVEVLCETARKRFERHEYDDSTSIGVRCTWALRMAGGELAMECLRDLAASDERQEVREAAQYQLDEIAKGN